MLLVRFTKILVYIGKSQHSQGPSPLQVQSLLVSTGTVPGTVLASTCSSLSRIASSFFCRSLMSCLMCRISVGVNLTSSVVVVPPDVGAWLESIGFYISIL